MDSAKKVTRATLTDARDTLTDALAKWDEAQANLHLAWVSVRRAAKHLTEALAQYETSQK